VKFGVCAVVMLRINSSGCYTVLVAEWFPVFQWTAVPSCATVKQSWTA